MSLRVSHRHYDYLCSAAVSNNMNVSELARTIIEKAEREFRSGGLSKVEVVAYLKNLPHEERDELVKSVETREERIITAFMNGILEKNPGTSVKKLCGKASEKFNVPVTMDLRRMADLRIRSHRRKRKFIAKIEKENDELFS